jgi:hypothetical protein
MNKSGSGRVVNTSAVCPEAGWSRDGSARSAHPSASSALASAAGRLTGAPGQRRHSGTSLLLFSIYSISFTAYAS